MQPLSIKYIVSTNVIQLCPLRGKSNNQSRPALLIKNTSEKPQLKTFDNIWICTLPLTHRNTQLKETTLLGFLVLDLNLINKISKGFDFTPTQCNSRWTKKLCRYISFSLHFININIFESSKVFKFWEVGIGLYSTNLYCRLEDINTCYCVKCTFVDILMLAIFLQTAGFVLGQLYCLIV